LFLIRCEVKGQGCRMYTDCKALWGKFVICGVGLYKMNWIEYLFMSVFMCPHVFLRAVKRLKVLIGLITGFCGLIMINHILPIFSVYFVRT